MRIDEMKLDEEINSFEAGPDPHDALVRLEALREKIRGECKEDLGANFDEGFFEWWFASQLLLRAMIMLGFALPQAPNH